MLKQLVKSRLTPNTKIRSYHQSSPAGILALVSFSTFFSMPFCCSDPGSNPSFASLRCQLLCFCFLDLGELISFGSHVCTAQGVEQPPLPYVRTRCIACCRALSDSQAQHESLFHLFLSLRLPLLLFTIKTGRQQKPGNQFSERHLERKKRETHTSLWRLCLLTPFSWLFIPGHKLQMLVQLRTAFQQAGKMSECNLSKLEANILVIGAEKVGKSGELL